MTLTFRVSWSHNWACISSHIWDNGPQHIGVMNLTLQSHITSSVTWPFKWSRESPVTWPFDTPSAISSLYVFYCNRVSISSHFWDIRPQTYCGRNLDLYKSCAIIGNVTKRFAYIRHPIDVLLKPIGYHNITYSFSSCICANRLVTWPMTTRDLLVSHRNFSFSTSILLVESFDL